MSEHSPQRIVVGVDQSAIARTVLQYALADAVRRGASVDVVTAYHDPEYWAIAYGVPSPPVNPGLRRGLLADTQRLVDELVGGLEGGAPPVRVRAVAGAPANVLLAAAAGADLLVVGHRGHGGFASMVLGSVGLQCVLHAPCPVTIVRPVAVTIPEPQLTGAAAASR